MTEKIFHYHCWICCNIKQWKLFNNTILTFVLYANEHKLVLFLYISEWFVLYAKVGSAYCLIFGRGYERVSTHSGISYEKTNFGRIILLWRWGYMVSLVKIKLDAEDSK